MMDTKKTAPLGRILVVDDELGMRVALTDVLERAGWEVEAHDAPDSALERLRTPDEFALLMTDYRMPGMTGLELTREARALRPDMPIVMMTAFGTVEDAVTAMKEGADDYLLKPFSFETVLSVIKHVLGKKKRAERTPAGSNGRKRSSGGPGKMLGDDPAWSSVVRMAEDVADSQATVLLMGESGTGKEVLARHIHEKSGRRGPLVAINCAALPEGVLESELFGHEKGAFTGAVLSRKGRFEMADGGTILLDEVSEIPLGLQAKLLRVLQEREVSPIGGTHSVKLDIRVIATTNRDLEKYVEEGHFRQDLYYRLNVIAICLPPLRRRPHDILPLAERFLRRFQRPERSARKFSSEVSEFLLRYPWTGNVRELENLVERASLLARAEEISIGDLHLSDEALARGVMLDEADEPGSDARSHPSLAGQTLEAMERRLILQTLDRTAGNRTRTAALLGVSVRTVRNKLNHYGLNNYALAGK